MYLESQAGARGRLRTEAGWQRFDGEVADALEFTPAPYYGEVDGRFLLPAGVQLEARVQGMGAKRYQGYGVLLRVPPHFENNVALDQAILGDYLHAHIALFHAFGDAIQEHPLGSPLRFRVVAGVTGKIR